MSAPRRDSSQSPDPTSGHGMGGSAKNGVDNNMMPNGPILQSGDYDQWRSHSIYSHNGGFGPLTSTQPAPPVPGDYMTSYYATSPYDHHGGWTTAAPPSGFYHHPQGGLSPPVNNQYMDHLTLFGAGPAPGGNNFFYNYFPSAPTNGSDYNAWGGASIIAAPRNAATQQQQQQQQGGGGVGSKHSEFYYNPMTDGGYTQYFGTDIVGGGGVGTNGAGRVNASQQQSSNLQQFNYLDQGVSRMSVYDDAVSPTATIRGGQNAASGPYCGVGVGIGGGGGGAQVGHQVGIGVGSGGGSNLGQNLSMSGESKKKSWATIASQPAKPNSGGGVLGGPLVGGGKSRGRMPIGGVPGSASIDSGAGSQIVGDTGGINWSSPPPPLQSNQNEKQQPSLDNSTSTPAIVAGGHVSQRSYGGGLVRNASTGGGGVGGFWNSTQQRSNTKPSNVDTVQTTPLQQTQAVNGGGSSDSENGDYNQETIENEKLTTTISATEVKNSNLVSEKSSDSQRKPPPQQQQQPQRSFDKVTLENDYNPKEFALGSKGARYFVIKSYSEDDIHRSIKYGIWCSTEHGNKRLDGAYREREAKGPIYLLFSVNGSGHFCGVAQMTSPLDYNKSSGVWAQDKWKGQFTVKWIYVKDVPNAQLRHIRLENNENKPVTNSRDTQEVLPEKGRQVVKIIHQYRHTTSLFDDFGHYEKRQEEEDQRKGRRGNEDE